MSTSQKARPFHSAREKWRSRVVPASSETMALSSPTMRLNSADLPTFGRPISATTGTLMLRAGRQLRLAFEGQHVDEVVRGIDRHRQRLAQRDEALVVEEEAVVVDRFGGNQREIEVVPVGERATNVRADEQPGGGRGRTEERVLHDDQLERRAGRARVSCVEQLGHERAPSRRR